MGSWQLAVPFALCCLSGCAPAEFAIGTLVPDQFRASPELGLGPVQHDRTIEPSTVPKPKVASRQKLEPSDSAPEPNFPPWTTPAPKPGRVLQSSLTPSELFKNLSPSVYTVAVLSKTLQQVASQGSAVAISSREAITSCHVVSNGGMIVLINGAATLNAQIVGADNATDRCYLRADGDLRPVPGLRDYSSLVVGETVYTIGSPKGLVNTLGSGLLSGLRTSEDKTHYIQISAPVSAGSSGGGLFDDRGNLIGIVSFTIKDAQNLNFAIAASQFWR
jgi:S1-C subfamily serine protease